MEQLPLTPLDPKKDRKKNVVLIIFLLVWCAMCSHSCKSTYHLKRAIAKNPELSLTDTVTQYKTLPGVTARIPYPLFVTTPSVEVNNIKVNRIVQGDTVYFDVECPEQEIVTKYVPKVRFIKEELTDRELFREAKKRFSQTQILRIAREQIAGGMLFGAFIMFCIWLYFKIR